MSLKKRCADNQSYNGCESHKPRVKCQDATVPFVRFFEAGQDAGLKGGSGPRVYYSVFFFFLGGGGSGILRSQLGVLGL